ncbi:type II toxin-antitoxin system Phd/YefM family antitoxin [Nonomuraea sp. NPDC059194]|uniref:type II toxin-antitoxin system Phd/YefM family antitoxin n=1 Tax=Nonomuraea sp. NPDC059194 TaxID=3346764 RepID=UPI00369D6711
MTIDKTSLETFGIAAARDKLGLLVSKAVIGHHPTRIKRSDDEQAVLISEEAYEEYLRLKRQREIDDLRARMESTSRETIERDAYSSREQAYADLGLGGAHQ